MEEDQDKINMLLVKLNELLSQQDKFSRQIGELKTEIYKLKSSSTRHSSKSVDALNKDDQKNIDYSTVEESTVDSGEVDRGTNVNPTNDLANHDKPIISPEEFVHTLNTETTATDYVESISALAQETTSQSNSSFNRDIEKFIGENLINKIGILIILAGVIIGAKYSIDNNLINPLTRIILGYLVGIGLLGIGLKLKTSYDNFSAVLVSGAMAIFYSITFFAYDFYNLIPAIFAFCLMVLFTVFTVIASIKYDKQIIAMIGLVGAYGVPFLLSDGSGDYLTLFSYISIINVGILFVSLKKYWKWLYYSAFLATWSIYTIWVFDDYEEANEVALAGAFLIVFFLTFYVTFLAYKLINKEKFAKLDVVMVMLNSFIFYGLGISLLETQEDMGGYLGLFTLANAAIHFLISIIVYRHKLADRNVFFLITGLVLTFLTIAIPVQLEGNWVTLLWAGEAALLFWIGRSRAVRFYEVLSYPLIVLTLFSLAYDWSNVSSYYLYNRTYINDRGTPFFNVTFLISLLATASIGFINYLKYKEPNEAYKATQVGRKKSWLSSILSYAIPAALILVAYYTFKIEIEAYWNTLYVNSQIQIPIEGENHARTVGNDILLKYKSIWILNYSMLFFSILSLINLYKIKSRQLGMFGLALNAIFLISFLSGGLFILSELRESYTEQTLVEYYNRGSFSLYIRYISYVFVALLLYVSDKSFNSSLMNIKKAWIFKIILAVSILWILSAELIHWMEIFDSEESYKLSLSILWGAYSLLLVGIGIWKKNKHLRILAIVIFTITLLKLFLYDVSGQSTIGKTVAFLSLGVLLIIISFLYNKYKHVISEDNEA